MQPQITCPLDGKDDTIQKVSAIVSSGTSTSVQIGIVGLSNGSFGAIPMRGTSRTQLAALLAPPRNAKSARNGSKFVSLFMGIGGIAFALVFLLCNYLYYGQYDHCQYYSSSPWSYNWISACGDYATWIVISEIVLPLAVLMLLVNIGITVVYREKWNQEDELWPQRIKRWNQLYYCYRCDGLFLPSEQPVVPPSMMYTLLDSHVVALPHGKMRPLLPQQPKHRHVLFIEVVLLLLLTLMLVCSGVYGAATGNWPWRVHHYGTPLGGFDDSAGKGLDTYCTTLGFRGVEVRNYVWYCVAAQAPINLDQACQWAYPDSAPDPKAGRHAEQMDGPSSATCYTGNP